MITFWLMFYAALALLFYPSDAALPRHVKLRIFDSLDFSHESWARQGSTWWFRAMWLEPARAFLGAWLLVHAWKTDAVAGSVAGWAPFVVNAMVLTVALTVQLHTRRDAEVLLAPIGYVAGLWFALLSPAVAALAVAVGAGGVIAFRTWSAFFFGGALYIACAGLWIMGRNLHVPLCAGLAMLPWVASAVSGRLLIQPLRSAGRSEPAREVSVV